MDRILDMAAQRSEPTRIRRRLHVAELQAIEALAVSGDALIPALAVIAYDWRVGVGLVGVCVWRVAMLRRAHAQVRADIWRAGYNAGRLAGIYEEAEALRAYLPTRPAAEPSPAPRSDD